MINLDPHTHDKQQAKQTDAGAAPEKAALHRVPEGVDHTVRVRIVAAKDLGAKRIRLACQPRQGASRRDADLVDLPPQLISGLQKFEGKLLSWLAASEENQLQFLRDPRLALKSAGGDFSRAHMALLDRVRAEAAAAEVLPPGTQLRGLALEVAADQKGPRSRTGRGKVAHHEQKGA